ncbi:MAG: lipopolysaccharide assembly protein LapB [Coxiellaceae bacterium]|nr:lipopolysaccharide assembly protein LapB [Coxiellaceae bacterium]
MLQYLFLLLPVAAVTGWYTGNKQRVTETDRKKMSAQIRRDYFAGLNYLINEQPDKAVDVFVRLLEVDSDTVETHLALGSLFRRRGEVDRAIRIHQNLIARPQLAKEYRVQALSELGQDYLSAGVLDRAERLFLELVELGEENVASLKYLLHIYQQEKNWQQAIATAHKLSSSANERMDHVIAQYYCELAQKALSEANPTEAERCLKRATATDSKCVRASMMKAEIAAERQDYRAAVRYYQRIREQDPDFLTEIVSPLCQCYRALNDEQGMVDYLHECLLKFPRVSIVLALSDYLQSRYDEHAAIEFIAEQIQRTPSLRGLKHLVALYLLHAHGDMELKLSILDNLMTELLADKPIYQCSQCGFSGQSMYWLCPSCNHWSSLKPIQGLEGS